MNAKKLLLIGLCAICFAATAASDDPPSGIEQILLHGRLDTSAGTGDVEAYIGGNNVYIYFNRNFGDVTITLYDPYNYIVYNDVVDTFVQQQVIIPISCLADGLYTIILETQNGFMEGEFGDEQ